MAAFILAVGPGFIFYYNFEKGSIIFKEREYKQLTIACGGTLVAGGRRLRWLPLEFLLHP